MAEKTVDLHLHTHYSDGTETPRRVVELAREAGLSAIAITDHDNTDAFPEAHAAASSCGIELIAGIEMSAAANGVEVHMLGYFFDRDNAALKSHLTDQQQRRINRVHAMVAELAKVGIVIDAQEVLTLAGPGTVGRPHVARILVKHGHVSSMPEAFDRYIGDGKPGFISGSTVAPSEIIRLIRQASGVPVLAHPIYLKNDNLIDQFTREGLAGLEVYHSSHTPEQIRRYEQIAQRLKLLKTGGSDYHGNAKEGLPVGAVKAPYVLLESLRQWKPS